MYYWRTFTVNQMNPKNSSFGITLVVGALLCLGVAPAVRANASRRLDKRNFDQPTWDSTAKQFNCLPKDVSADEEVGRGFKGKPGVTVNSKLIEIKARCRRGKLVDAKGREIRFFRPSCWGNPPENYREIRRREAEELARLRQRYTVIEFGCDRLRN